MRRIVQVHYVYVVELEIEDQADGTTKVLRTVGRPWIDVEQEVNVHGDAWDPDGEEDSITHGWRESTEDEWQAGTQALDDDGEAIDEMFKIIRDEEWNADLRDSLLRILNDVRPQQEEANES